jgi:hypothetical protein
MNRRSFLAAFGLAPVLAALAACSGSDKSKSPTPGLGSDTTPGSGAPGSDIAHRPGAEDVVVKLSNEGGLAGPGGAFTNVPALLITGDGHVYTPGVPSSIVPGPLLPSVLVRTITESGFQALLAILQRSALVAPPPDYTGAAGVADGQTTVLTINAGGGSFVHSAYALGAASPESAARQKLLDVVNALSDVESTIGEASFTPNQPYVSTKYRVQARVVDQASIASQQPSIVDWPGQTSVPLASAATCADVDAAAVGSLLTDAKQNTYFKDAGVIYQVSAVGVLPGDAAC